MMSMFSSFDLFFFKFAQFIATMVFSVISLYCFKLSVKMLMFSSIINFMTKFLSSLKPEGISKKTEIFLVSIFLVLMYSNLFSVMSYNFPLTSQLSLVASLSFTIWIGLMMFTLFNSMKGFFSHCIPEGTPIFLTWFLFFIEVVSNLIRPITVTVRLVANILAGHLLMILLSKLVFSLPFLGISYLMLNLVEFAVALIQSYIFVTMLTLYYSEIK